MLIPLRRPTLTSEFTFEIVRSIKRFESLREEWDTLVITRSSPLCCWEWFYAALLAFHHRDNLYTVALRRKEKIAAIAPLIEFSRPSGNYLAFIGFAALHEPCDFIYDDFQAMESLLVCLCNLGRPVYCERLPLESSSSEAITRALCGSGFVIKKSVGASCCLPLLQPSWEDFLARLSSKKRYDIRRGYKRAQAVAPIHCNLITPDAHTLPSLLDKVFSIEARSWKGRVGSAVLSNPAMKSFFDRYCKIASEKGYLRIALLDLGGSLVASLIGAVLGNSFWVFKIGYDEHWSRYSPGILLINETIRYSLDNGLKSYEFLGTDEPWIHLWTGNNNVHKYELVAFYPYKVSAAARLATDAGKFLLRRLYSIF